MMTVTIHASFPSVLPSRTWRADVGLDVNFWFPESCRAWLSRGMRLNGILTLRGFRPARQQRTWWHFQRRQGDRTGVRPHINLSWAFRPVLLYGPRQDMEVWSISIQVGSLHSWGGPRGSEDTWAGLPYFWDAPSFSVATREGRDVDPM